MLILGIDPGTLVMGWGIIETDGDKLTYVASGVIKTKGVIGWRLFLLHTGLDEVLGDYNPGVVAMESGYVGSNPMTSLVIGYARAVVLMAAASAGCKVVDYTPAEVKRAVVGGGASKEQVQEMVNLLLGTKIDDDNESDALAVAICHANASQAADVLARGAG